MLLICAGVALLMTVGWLVASRQINSSVDHGPTRTDRVTLLRVLRLSSVRTILVISLFSFFFAHGLNNCLPEILVDAGQSDDAAGYLAAVSVTCGIAGSLLIARLVAGARRPLGLVVIFGVLATTDIGAATGLFFAAGEIGGFGGPYVLGFVADRTDGFGAATAVLAVVALAGALASAGLTRVRHSDPDHSGGDQVAKT